MTLIDDWRRLAPKLWSIRLSLLAAALGALEVALPVFSDELPHGIFAALSMLVAVAAAASRLIAQPKLTNDPPAAP